MDPSAKHFFTRGEPHYEPKQMPGLTKLFIDSKTSSHTYNCLTSLLHIGDVSEEITDALTLEGALQGREMWGDDAEGTQVLSLFVFDQTWSSLAELAEFLWGCRRGKDIHNIYNQLRRCSHSSWSHSWSLTMAEQKNRHCFCKKMVNGMHK